MYNKTNRNKKRTEIQEIAVNLLYKYSRILLSWATGCGKSLAAMKMLEHWLKYQKTKPKGYIIFKEHTHLNNWNDDEVKHGKEWIGKISEKFLYASLHKYSDKGYVDFVILDEVHGITPKRVQHLSKIIGPNTIVFMLSATVPPEKAALISQLIGRYHEYHISIVKAIRMGILPPPVIYIHKFNMSADQLREYNILESKVDIAGEHYDYTNASDDFIKWQIAGNKRKTYMGEIKTENAFKILKEHFKGSRFIAFTNSKEQCVDLTRKWAKAFGSKHYNFVNSDRSKKDVEETRNKFNDKKISEIFAVDMMREAVNLEGVEKGLIVQLGSKKLSFIQMLGRVFRSALPEMHIIVWKDTKDEKYFNWITKDIPNNYIKVLEHGLSRVTNSNLPD